LQSATTNKFLTPGKQKERETKVSKNFKTRENKRSCTLHLRETHDTVSQTRRKKEEHVPRHIELTAVLRDLRQRIE
jgi:hypothetical protein